MIRVMCAQRHDRTEMPWDHWTCAYHCPVCRDSLTREAVRSRIPAGWEAAMRLGLLGLADVGAIDIVFGPGWAFQVEFPRRRDVETLSAAE